MASPPASSPSRSPIKSWRRSSRGAGGTRGPALAVTFAVAESDQLAGDAASVEELVSSLGSPSGLGLWASPFALTCLLFAQGAGGYRSSVAPGGGLVGGLLGARPASAVGPLGAGLPGQPVGLAGRWPASPASATSAARPQVFRYPGPVASRPAATYAAVTAAFTPFGPGHRGQHGLGQDPGLGQGFAHQVASAVSTTRLGSTPWPLPPVATQCDAPGRASSSRGMAGRGAYPRGLEPVGPCSTRFSNPCPGGCTVDRGIRPAPPR